MLYIARYRGREQERALYSSYPLRTRSHLQRFLCLCPARSSHSHPRDALNPSSWDQPILCYIIAGRVQTPRCGHRHRRSFCDWGSCPPFQSFPIFSFSFSLTTVCPLCPSLQPSLTLAASLNLADIGISTGCLLLCGNYLLWYPRSNLVLLLLIP